MAEKDTKKSSGSLKALHFLLDSAVKCPNRQQYVIEELLRILKTTDFDVKCLKTTLAFHKSLCPIAVVPLERRLFACGVLGEADVTKPSVSSFLSKILFEVVTTSSAECAEYCANVWSERVEAQHRKLQTESIKLELPNPMNFLNREDFAQQGSFILASLTTEQWHMLLLECTSLLEFIPCQFYSRVIVGLFFLLKLYESQLRMNNDGSCLPEIEDWTDTWMHLLATSLFGKFKSPQETLLIQTQPSNFHPPLHHILCGVMVATESFKLLKSNSSACRKVLKGLEQLILSSAGFTSTWLKTVKFYFEL